MNKKKGGLSHGIKKNLSPCSHNKDENVVQCLMETTMLPPLFDINELSEKRVLTCTQEYTGSFTWVK